MRRLVAHKLIFSTSLLSSGRVDTLIYMSYSESKV